MRAQSASGEMGRWGRWGGQGGEWGACDAIVRCPEPRGKSGRAFCPALGLSR